MPRAGRQVATRSATSGGVSAGLMQAGALLFPSVGIVDSHGSPGQGFLFCFVGCCRTTPGLTSRGGCERGVGTRRSHLFAVGILIATANFWKVLRMRSAGDACSVRTCRRATSGYSLPSTHTRMPETRLPRPATYTSSGRTKRCRCPIESSLMPMSTGQSRPQPTTHLQQQEQEQEQEHKHKQQQHDFMPAGA